MFESVEICLNLVYFCLSSDDVPTLFYKKYFMKTTRLKLIRKIEQIKNILRLGSSKPKAKIIIYIIIIIHISKE